MYKLSVTYRFDFFSQLNNSLPEEILNIVVEFVGKKNYLTMIGNVQNYYNKYNNFIPVKSNNYPESNFNSKIKAKNL